MQSSHSLKALYFSGGFACKRNVNPTNEGSVIFEYTVKMGAGILFLMLTLTSFATSASSQEFFVCNYLISKACRKVFSDLSKHAKPNKEAYLQKYSVLILESSSDIGWHQWEVPQNRQMTEHDRIVKVRSATLKVWENSLSKKIFTTLLSVICFKFFVTYHLFFNVPGSRLHAVLGKGWHNSQCLAAAGWDQDLLENHSAFTWQSRDFRILQ